MVVVPNLWVMLTGKPAEEAESAGPDEAALDEAGPEDSALDAADAGLVEAGVLLVAPDVLDDPQADTNAPTASAAIPAAQRRDLLADNRSARSVGRVSLVVKVGPSGQVEDPTGGAHDTGHRRAVDQVSLTYR